MRSAEAAETTSSLGGEVDLAPGTIPGVPSGVQHLDRGFGPVTILLERDHEFIKKSAKASKTCGVCGGNKLEPQHGPFSSGEFGSGANRWAYQNANRTWKEAFLAALRLSDLPLNCKHIFVEGRMCFPTRAQRDQGNFRYPVEKFLGDALQADGYIINDKWGCYEFGQLARVDIPGESWVQLMLMPT